MKKTRRDPYIDPSSQQSEPASSNPPKRNFRIMVLNRKKFLTICSAAMIAVLLLVLLIPLCMKAISVSAAVQQHPIYSVDTDRKAVALGINAAWGDEDTDAFLKTLKDREVKATFFVLGEFVQKYENAVVRIHAAGHEVQSHSDTHPDMKTLNADEIKKQLNAAARKIKKVTGVAPTLFRAPSGSYNSQVIQTANEMGYHCIQWSIDTIDWKDPTPEEMVERVTQKLAPGAILLLHLGSKNTPAALPLIIDAIKEAGYEIVPVSELIYQENYTVDRQGVQHSTATQS